MGASIVYVFYALVVYITYWFIKLWINNSRIRQFALRNGCEEPQRNTLVKLPWGIDGMYKLFKAVADGQDILDDLVIPRFAKLNATTIVGTGLFGAQITDTIDPQNLQALLATQFKDFGTGERRGKQFGALLGKNIFTSDGDFWSHSRAMFRPLFNREQMNDLEETDRASKILIDVLPKAENGWTEEVRLLDYFYRFTMDTASAFLFGNTTDSQLAAAGRLTSEKGSITEMATDQDFARSFAVAQEWLSWRIRMQGLYWLVQSPKWWKATANVRSFVNQYVRLALEQQAQEERLGKPVREGKKYNLLLELVKECRDPTELRDQLLGKSNPSE
jgi:cytochrome P450